MYRQLGLTLSQRHKTRNCITYKEISLPHQLQAPVAHVPHLSHTLTGKDNLINSLYTDDSDDEVADITQVDEKINEELHYYKAIKLSHKQKKDTHLLTWWRDCKTQFPYLFQAVKALLATPATSVPSERIFSEAGYIARARRSRILPKNLNKFIFIKKNKKYIPELSKQDLSQEEL